MMQKWLWTHVSHHNFKQEVDEKDYPHMKVKKIIRINNYI